MEIPMTVQACNQKIYR